MDQRLVLFFLFLFGYSLQLFAQETLSLAGEWGVRLDPQKTGEQQGWYKQVFEKKIQLPGTLDDAGIGEPPTLTDQQVEKDVMLHLARKHSYIGYAWYAREVNIPESWKRKRIELFLERVLWTSEVWIDGVRLGMRESLSAPHRYDLRLAPGRHLIVIGIDNSRRYDISHLGMAHAYTEGTQIIWNGVIGRMQLIARPRACIQSLQVYPSEKNKTIVVNTVFGSDAGRPETGVLHLQVLDRNKKVVAQKVQRVTLAEGGTKVSATIAVPACSDWDEFSPSLYTLNAVLDAGDRDRASAFFGMRDLGNNNSLLSINGRRLFLRGTLECNIFPLTGHPPMDRKGWLKVFSTAKAYGLNHLRFHSWCPPEAAFEVADSMGFYLQVELPFWNMNAGKDVGADQFLTNEAYLISLEYGNHPSFCLWSMGNELGGDLDWLAGIVRILRHLDPRHLYTSTTFTFQDGHGKWPEPGDDYYITQYTKKGWIRGQGIFNDFPPDFKSDYTKAVDGLPVPVVIHEMGQYSVYPNLDEIQKYTGVLDPLNFRAVRNDLFRKGLAGLAPAFTRASGVFSAGLYKEEIERAMRTRGISGFELLDLHDFPGQGTALIGILDAFWDSKGLVTPEQHRMYCSAVVPLLRFERAAYTSDQRFVASAEVANFGAGVLKGCVPLWTVTDAAGRVVASGRLAPGDVAVGSGQQLGEVNFDLHGVRAAGMLTIELSLKGTPYKNRWKIWVYPTPVSTSASPYIVVDTLLEQALIHLKEGKKVLLNPDTASIHGVAGRFAPVFWSPVHFPNQPGTMGILCDPAHPALKDFPTEFHSDWQWWDLITSSKTMILDSLPAIDPIVRVIDNFFKNRKMADVIEARVGDGRLVLVSADITHGLGLRPVARQLRYSLEHYMSSAAFAPAVSLTPSQLGRLVGPAPIARDGVRSSGADTILARYRRAISGVNALRSQEVARLVSGYDSVRQWSDIVYSDTSRGFWSPLAHLDRIRTLALEWSDTSSGHFHDKAIWQVINGALDNWLEKRYHNSNWWHNEIGIPQYMRDILVLLGDSLGARRRSGALQVLGQYRLQQPGNGANLVWSADLGLHYGALTGNDSLIRICADRLIGEVHITTGDGIQSDYSFHQHLARLQMYQYGAAYLQQNARLARQLKGTPWAYPEDRIRLLTSFVLEGWQWMCRGVNTVPGTIDRSVSRIGALHAGDLRGTIPYLCELDPSRAVSLQALAARQDGGGEPLQGFRYYPRSDFSVYQGRQFGFFLKTMSDRTLPSESINSENLKGRWLNAGDAYMIGNGKEYYDLMPVWDWEHLPGITGCAGGAAGSAAVGVAVGAAGGANLVRHAFTGGVSDGQSGVTVMDYQVGEGLTARKFWACHDGVVVCLIGDLRSDAAAYTTIDQCRWQGNIVADGRVLSEGVDTLNDVRWIQHAGKACIFLRPSKLVVRAGSSSGSWQSINASEPSTPVTEKLYMPVMLHSPGTDSCGYVLTACATPREARSLARRPSWNVVRNGRDCQVVRFKDGLVVGAFYTGGSLALDGHRKVTVDQPCLLMVEKDAVYISDPSQKGMAVKVSVNGVARTVQLPGDGTTVVERW